MKAVITGHGLFAVGLKSALELITGPQDDLQAIVFTEDTVLSEYQKSFDTFINTQEEGFIFTDLIGGTPFNAAMMAKADNTRFHVFGGTNLTMLLKYYEGCIVGTTRLELVESILECGRDGIQEGLIGEREKAIDEEEGEGI